MDWIVPQLDHPLDIEYFEGDTHYSITWNLSDMHPASYIIYRDETIVQSGSWNESSEIITISIDGLPVGTYVFRITATDANGNVAYDEVIVKVLANTISSTNWFFDNPLLIISLAITIGSCIIIAVFGSLIYKSRKS